uniref:CgeB family protein n=1 Tax=Ningiella ruwaisensis TaxID=2364274 RepID=UPI00109FF811|nr:glycosyltransferase [Ningiella ruwaisensis]
MTNTCQIKQFETFIAKNSPRIRQLPNDKRMAIIIDDAILFSKTESAVKNHELAKAFVMQGFEVLCLYLPNIEELEQDKAKQRAKLTKYEATLEGVRYFNLVYTESDRGNWFSQSSTILIELFKVFRPQFVLCWDDLRVRMSAFAATVLTNIPFVFALSNGIQNDANSRQETSGNISNGFDDSLLFIIKNSFKTLVFNEKVHLHVVNQGLEADKILHLDSSARKHGLQASVDNKQVSAFRFNVKPLLNDVLKLETTDNVIFTKELPQSNSELEKFFAIEKVVLTGKTPHWYQLDVKHASYVSVSGRVDYFNLSNVKSKRAVLLIKVLDENGNDLCHAMGKLGYSSQFKTHFKYIADTDGNNNKLHTFNLPEGATHLQFGLSDFNCMTDESICVKHLTLAIKRRKNDALKRSLLTKAPRKFEFEVNELISHTIAANFEFESQNDNNPKAIVAGVTYFDSQNDIIPPPYGGLMTSKTIGSFCYLNLEGDNVAQLIPPKAAAKLELAVQTWQTKKKVWLKGAFTCKSDLVNLGTTALKATVSSDERKEARPLSEIKVAAILDEFTLECFRMEVRLTQLTPIDWKTQIEAAEPDMLFVESCWFGNKNQWGGLIYGYTSNGPNQMSVLIQVLNYCRQKGIPTVFWSKEDPVHYSRFAPTAKLFDYVYTTDANMISNYAKEHNIQAESLSFFCQPKVHNPINLIPRLQKAAFAGSYYSDKKERCDNFHTIIGALETAKCDYDIFDRCLKRGVAHLQFPERFKSKVVGYLEPEDMWKAYKGYKYTVNLNSVKHSPTMFARRVYESLASGTPVISNYSEGVLTQFGGIVCASDKQHDIVEFINRLKDEKEYQKIAESGAREALGRHTIADRLIQICDRLGITVMSHLPIMNAMVSATSVEDIERARTLFKKQTYHNKRLIVDLQNSNELYPYLNRNAPSEVFRVNTEFAKPLEGVCVSIDFEKDVKPTMLEDEAISTLFNTNKYEQSE